MIQMFHMNQKYQRIQKILLYQMIQNLHKTDLKIQIPPKILNLHR